MFANFSPRSDNPFVRWWLSIDRVSLVIMVALAIFGVIMVGTASPSVATRIGLDSYHFLIRHIMFLIPAMGAMFILGWLAPKNIWRLSTGLYIIAFIGVLLAITTGMEIKGATRWIRIAGFSIQPSEFIKPAFIVLAAWLLGQQKENEHFPGIMIALVLYVVTAFALLLQPDFGMTFLITLVFAMQIFLAGCPLRLVVALAGLGLVGLMVVYTTLPHVQTRIDGFLFPAAADSYQIDRSKEAFMNGGLIGTGLGQGSLKNQVPDIHADFIFTAIGEEWGFMITALFVAGLGYLFFRLFSRFARSESIFVMLAGSGLTFMLVGQSFIHMGSTLQLIPPKGMTLPFISYGGSSLIAVGIAFGLILALSRGINDDRTRSTWRHLKKKAF